MPPHVDDETTLTHHLITGIDSLIEGKVPAASMRLYSAQDHATPSYTRDTSCWANDIAAKLTAISPWNSHGSYTQAGVLISPRHVLFATHFFPPTGTTIRFVTTANVVVDRTLSATESLTVTKPFWDVVAHVSHTVDGNTVTAAQLMTAVVAILPSIESYNPQ